MALWIPVIVVPRSSATVAIETFITELSSAIRNCPAHSASSTAVAPAAARALVLRLRHPAAPSPAPAFGRLGPVSA